MPEFENTRFEIGSLDFRYLYELVKLCSPEKRETTMNTKNSWTELIVTDSDGNDWGLLSDIVKSAPANLDNAKIEGGRIIEWDGFFLSGEEEDADWDTPRTSVNWDGFSEELGQVRG